MEQCSIDHLKNPDRKFSLEPNQNLNCRLKPQRRIVTNEEEKTSNNGEGKRGKSTISSLLFPRSGTAGEVNNNKEHIVHFIILTLKTLTEKIARKDKGKG
jgi:hypothetical protein